MASVEAYITNCGAVQSYNRTSPAAFQTREADGETAQLRTLCINGHLTSAYDEMDAIAGLDVALNVQVGLLLILEPRSLLSLFAFHITMRARIPSSRLSPSFLCVAASSQTKSLWSMTAANFDSIIRSAYPVGNGRLAALPFGEAGREKFSLNRDDLCTGGPFESASYNGGNTSSPLSQYLPGIRDWIWKDGAGNVTALMGGDNDYGSYTVLGNLSVAIAGVSNVSDSIRALDPATGVLTTAFRSGSCSYTM